MGTLHSGSSLAAWAKLPARYLRIFKQTNKSLLFVLETDSEVLNRAQDEYLSMLRTTHGLEPRMEALNNMDIGTFIH
jgi:hypothetical protein